MISRFRHLFERPKNTVLILGGLAVVALAVAWPHLAFADIADTIFNNVLSPIVTAMIQLFALLTAYIVGLLVLVAQYPHYINATPVVTGYPIVRDLANMMFIIALLIIAAGTILRLENYRYNRLLGRLIVMAFLVNLARFITGFFIQTSQVFMLTFVNAFKDIALGNFAYMFGLDKVLNFSQQGLAEGSWPLFITLVAGLAMMIIAFSVTLALVVILVVRIVALWILTILSPLAYALRIIPNTEKYASQWWSYFGKYLVTGPVMVFFLWLALAISASSQACTGTSCNTNSSLFFQADDKSFENVVTNTDKQVAPFKKNLVSGIFDLPTLTTFIVSIIFLIMGMQFASSSGTVGARFAKQVYEGGIGAGSFATGLNYLRDRTVAPVQGWVANRQAARRAAIQERTAGLEYGTDRLKAGLGSEKGLASARVYEQQQVTRRRQQLGMGNFSDEQLYGDLGHQDKYRRGAALSELQSRGRVNLQDPSVRQLTDRVLSDQGLPPEMLRNLRQQIETQNLPAMSVNQLRQNYATAVSPDSRMRYFEQMVQKGGLNLGQAGDQQILQQMMTQAFRSPQEQQRLREMVPALMRNPNVTKDALSSMTDSAALDNAIRLGAGMEMFNRRYTDVRDPASIRRAQAILQMAGNKSQADRAEAIKSLGKNDADMLVEAEFGGLRGTTAAANVDRLFSQHQQGIVPDDVFTKDVQARIAAARGNDEQALANHLVEISPDQETLQKHYKNMDPEAAAQAFSHGFSVAGMTDEKRKAVARVTGQFGYAFDTSAETDPYAMNKVFDAYAAFLKETGGDKLADMIAEQALADPEVERRLRAAGVWRTKQVTTVRKRGERFAKAQADGLRARQTQMQTSRGWTWDRADKDNFQATRDLAEQLAVATKGEDLTAYDVMSTNEVTRETSRRQLENLFASTEAGELSKIGKGLEGKAYAKDIQAIYGRRAKPKDLAAMVTDEDIEFGEASLQAFVNYLEKLAKNPQADEDELRKARSRARKILDNPELSGYASFSEEALGEKKKGGSGEVLEGIADTALGATVIGSTQATREQTKAIRKAKKTDEDEEGPGEEPPTSLVAPTPPPPPPPGGAGQAYREAARSQPFRPGARIVAPPGSDFPSREERNLDPRISSLTPEQRALRQTAVDARRNAATRFLTEEEKYDKEAVLKGILNETEQDDFRALEKRFGSTNNPVTAEERRRYQDYAVKMGLADPEQTPPATAAQGAPPPVRPARRAPTPAAPQTPPPPRSEDSSRPSGSRRPVRPATRPSSAPTPATNVTIDATALENATRELADIQRTMTSNIADLASNFSATTTRLSGAIDAIRQVRPNTAQQLSSDLRKVDAKQLGSGDAKQVRNLQDILREISRHLRDMKNNPGL